MPALRKRLRDESYVDIRGEAGGGPQAIYVDEEEMPGAIRPTGTYSVQENQMTVNLILSLDGKKTRLQIEGSASEKDALVARIVTSLLASSETLE